MTFRRENTYCISWNEKTATGGTLDKSSNGRRRKLFEFHTQIKFSLLSFLKHLPVFKQFKGELMFNRC